MSQSELPRVSKGFVAIFWDSDAVRGSKTSLVGERLAAEEGPSSRATIVSSIVSHMSSSPMILRSSKEDSSAEVSLVLSSRSARLRGLISIVRLPIAKSCGEESSRPLAVL